jgi:3-methylfumaryl-CoA hydratase
VNAHADCIGRSRSHSTRLDPWPARALQATLDLAPELDGDVLPPLWHWLYFLEAAPRRCIGADGHPRNGSFLPELTQARRMFAGASTQFHAPLRSGREATLTESIRDLQTKHGRHGEMVIVTVGYTYHQQNRLCIDEQRSFVFLPATAAAAEGSHAEAPVPQTPWALDLPIDETLLFRYSALSFNSHRIPLRRALRNRRRALSGARRPGAADRNPAGPVRTSAPRGAVGEFLVSCQRAAVLRADAALARRARGWRSQPHRLST